MPKWFSITVIPLIAVLVAANILLLRQNGHLKGQLTKKPAALRPPVGMRMPPIKGLDTKGANVEVGWNDPRDTFVFIFSPDCGACRLAWPVWRGLASGNDARRHRLAYLSVQGHLPDDFMGPPWNHRSAFGV
jgi:hypothetical protein